MTPDPRAAALCESLRALRTADPVEQADRAACIELLTHSSAPFDESHSLEHVTASGYVVSELGLLLHRHVRLGIWIQPGGHVDAGETTEQAARREVLEETGIELDASVEATLLRVNRHPGPRHHRHLDIAYLFVARTTEFAPGPGESTELEWLSASAAIERSDAFDRPGILRALDAASARVPRIVAGWIDV